LCLSLSTTAWKGQEKASRLLCTPSTYHDCLPLPHLTCHRAWRGTGIKRKSHLDIWAMRRQPYFYTPHALDLSVPHSVRCWTVWLSAHLLLRAVSGKLAGPQQVAGLYAPCLTALHTSTCLRSERGRDVAIGRTWLRRLLTTRRRAPTVTALSCGSSSLHLFSARCVPPLFRAAPLLLLPYLWRLRYTRATSRRISLHSAARVYAYYYAYATCRAQRLSLRSDSAYAVTPPRMRTTWL